MANYYVSKAGSDANDGLSVATAKLTIMGCKAILPAGTHNVYVGIGTYTEMIAWSISATIIVNLIGDYDGTIFGSAAGLVEISSGSSMSWNQVQSVKRIRLTSTASSRYLIGNWLLQDVLFQYCEFQPVTGSNTNFFNLGADFTTRISIENCNLVSSTGWLTFVEGATSTANRNRVLIKDCDFKTYSSITAVGYFQGIVDFVNCSLKFKDATMFMPNGGGIQNYKNCTIQLTTTATTAIQPFTNNHVAINVHVPLNITLKDCTMVNTNNVSITLGDFVSTGSPTFLAPNYVQATTTTSIMSSQMGSYQTRVVLDNLNSSGTVKVFSPYGYTLEDVGTLYDSKLVYKIKTIGQSGRYPIFVLKLAGLDENSTYTLTFDYNKGATLATRIGVLHGRQKAADDLYTTPANALTYADYSSASHTQDTWYAKTLTFTTRASASQEIGGDEYYLVIYPSDTFTCNFKLTKPLLSKV